jgi:hypothetical protein
MVITGVLIAFAIICARRRGFSPLEMASCRANASFVYAREHVLL